MHRLVNTNSLTIKKSAPQLSTLKKPQRSKDCTACFKHGQIKSCMYNFDTRASWCQSGRQNTWSHIPLTYSNTQIYTTNQPTKKKTAVKQNHLLPPLKSSNLLCHWQLGNIFLVLKRWVVLETLNLAWNYSHPQKADSHQKGLEEAQGRSSIAYVWNQISLSLSNVIHNIHT